MPTVVSAQVGREINPLESCMKERKSRRFLTDQNCELARLISQQTRNFEGENSSPGTSQLLTDSQGLSRQ